MTEDQPQLTDGITPPGVLELAFWDPTATAAQYEALCAGAARTKARAVCIPTGRVALAQAKLEDTEVKVVALTGFPLGNSDPDARRFEAEAAIDNGAQEIETVLNHGRLKEGDARGVLRELRDIVEGADERPVCVVFETAWLTREEIVLACHLALDAGAGAVSAGTGFWPGSKIDAATIELLREATSPKFQIKAMPVTTAESVQAFLRAGATRCGVIASPG